MDEGVMEILAGAPGVILLKEDGNDDRNCFLTGIYDWNAIYVLHADSSIAWYRHFQDGSLTAKGVGDAVAEGEFLGTGGQRQQGQEQEGDSVAHGGGGSASMPARRIWFPSRPWPLFCGPMPHALLLSAGLTAPDFALIAAYFLLVFAVAWWATARDRKAGAEAGAADYFLAGRHAGWFVIGASLFASNIGSEHLVGLAGAGARGDLAAAQFEILAVLVLLLLGWVFAPFYLRSGVFTMPEFLERRFSPHARTYLAVISVLSYVLTKISVIIFAGALVFEELLGVPFWTGAVAVVVATGLYTMLGGLRAVIYTDLVQLFVLVGGSIAVSAFALGELGGWGAAAEAVTRGAGEGHSYFNLWRPASDPDYPWTGILFGAPILGIWYWCTDQFIVQRVLSARDETQARRGALFGGALKLLPLFLFVLPGVLVYALTVDVDPSLLVPSAEGPGAAPQPDRALPAMVLHHLPVGLRGLVTAGMLAALMSSLSSVFNSCSTLLTIDFYRRFRPAASEAALVRFGRWSTAALVALGLAWIPLMRAVQQDGGLFRYLQEVQAYISPPIAAVFLLGLFVPRLNARGANAALWTGFALGIAKLYAAFRTATPGGLAEGVDAALWQALAGINFLHYAAGLFALCAAVFWVVGRTGAAPDPARVAGLVWVPATGGGPDADARRIDRRLTVVLLAAVLLLWAWFSPLGMG